MSTADPATILIFNSGLGGLTVFREVLAARPDARFVYVADDAGFPYGNQPEDALIARIVAVIGKAIADHAPDLIVIACNTASTLALAELRARFSVPFVGTVPAIKPACAQSASKRIAVLGTLATVSREYTHALIREFAADCAVDLVGSPRLAPLRGSFACRRAGQRRRNRARDRALLRRSGRPPHRHGGARLYALPAAARTFPQTGAVAGDLARSGAGDRAPRRRSVARPAAGRCRAAAPAASCSRRARRRRRN